MKSTNLPASLVAALMMVWTTSAVAGEVDALIDKLVAKGMLTANEATEVRAEMASARASVPIQNLAATAPDPAPKSTGPSLLDRIRLKGDFRLRYQAEDLEGAVPAGFDLDEQNRWRIRWRAGVVADLTDRWETGFGFASGGADARSSNQTLRRGFERGDARLDYAYVKFKPSEHVDILGGKFNNPLWTPKDLLWDSDIRPDGVAVPMSFSLSPRADVFVTPAYYTISEDVAGRSDDVGLLALQVGVDWALSESVSLKFAPTYYNFTNLENTPSPVTVDAPTNTRDPSGNLANDYDALALGAQLAITGWRAVPRVTVFGEWVNAFDPSRRDTGWLLGVGFGDARIAGFGDWQVKYNYRRLEADAWPEFLTDSDALFGATRSEGSEIELTWGVAKGVSLSVDYYGGFELLGSAVEQDLVQLDLNIKW